MKSLIVIANPSKESFSHAIAQAYIASKKEQGNETELLDLYDIQQPYFAYQSMDELKKGNHNGGDTQKQVQELLTQCDEYVFIFPVWWGNIPAILKNFFDVNFSSGFAFKFRSGKSTPEKLLTDKTARIIYHCDAPGLLYRVPFIMGINIKKYLDACILGFCGVRVTSCHSLGGTSKATSQKKEAFISRVTQ